MTESNLLKQSSLMERLPGLREVHLFDELESTSDLGKQLATEDRLFPAIIYARKQTKGRGRGGKTWISSKGSLTFSFVIDQCFGSNTPDSNVANDSRMQQSPARFSIDWGLAVATALNELAQKENIFQVKWPNDVMALKRKVAGILIESVARSAHRQVVGIGINVSNAESLEVKNEIDATSIEDVANVSNAESLEVKNENEIIDATSIEDVANVELSHLEILEAIWKQFHLIQKLNEGDWLERYNQLDYLKNKSLTIQQGQSLVMGRYKGIGQDGELLLLTEDELRKVHSGSVVAIEG